MSCLDHCFPSHAGSVSYVVSSFPKIHDALTRFRNLELKIHGRSQIREDLTYQQPSSHLQGEEIAVVHRFGCIDHFHARTSDNWEQANLLLYCDHGRPRVLPGSEWELCLQSQRRRNLILLSCLENPTIDLGNRLAGLANQQIEFPGVGELLTKQPGSCVIHPICRLPYWFTGYLRDLILKNESHRVTRSFVEWFFSQIRLCYQMLTPLSETEFITKTNRIQKLMVQYEGRERPVTAWDYLCPLSFTVRGCLSNLMPLPVVSGSNVLERIFPFLPPAGASARLLAGPELLNLNPAVSPLVYVSPQGWLLWYPEAMNSAEITEHFQAFNREQGEPSALILQAELNAEMCAVKVPVLQLYGTSHRPSHLLDNLTSSSLIPEFTQSGFADFLLHQTALQDSGFYNTDDLFLIYLSCTLGIHLPKVRSVHGWMRRHCQT